MVGLTMINDQPRHQGWALAVIAAPLGCFVVWQRMAYFGETVAQASLIGVALGLALQFDITFGVLLVGFAYVWRRGGLEWD